MTQESDVTLTTTSKADPKAVAVARAVYDAMLPEKVILFGSRARGDYRVDSDIDLLIISDVPSKGRYMKAQNAASEAAHWIYGDYFGADLVWMPREKYTECRIGINHLAAQAARDGVDMNGEKEEYLRDQSVPFDWPDAMQRVVNADRELITMKVMVTGNSPQEAIGFHGHQALENILKGWISALGIAYPNTHDLADLIAVARGNPRERKIPAGEGLEWLTLYTTKYLYQGACIVMDDPIEVYHSIDRVVSAIGDRLKELAGVEELPRYTPPTQRRSGELGMD